MGRGPKASAANLEPLGKRRRFGNPADPSIVETCPPPACEARSANDLGPFSSAAMDSRSTPLMSTAQRTGSRIEPKVNTISSHATSAQVERPDISELPNAEPPRSAMRAASSGPIASTQITKETNDRMKRAPSPRTRLETSARALALAQGWQAKFKGWPKTPPVPNSPQKTDTREQSVFMASEKSKLSCPDTQLAPADECKSQGHRAVVMSDIDEEQHKRRRKSGPGPQASAANLEPLGEYRRGFSINSSVDGSSNLSGHQQPSSQVASVNSPAPRIHNPKPDAVPDSRSLSKSSHHKTVDQETVKVPKHLTTEAEDVGRNVGEFGYHSPSHNDIRPSTRTETSNNSRFEDVFRKRKRTPSPYRRHEGYKKIGHGGDRDRRHDTARDDVMDTRTSLANTRAEWTEAFFKEARPSRASSAKGDRITHSERDRAPARHQTTEERQYSGDYSNRHRLDESKLETTILPIETSAFLRDLIKGHTPMAEIVPFHPVDPIVTHRASTTVLDLANTTAAIGRKAIYNLALILSTDPGLTTSAVSINAVTRDIRMMKPLDQLDMSVTGILAVNIRNHPTKSFVPKTDTIIVAYMGRQENFEMTEIVCTNLTGAERGDTASAAQSSHILS